METLKKKGDNKKRQEKRKKKVSTYCLIYNNMCKIEELPSKHF